ncbi:MAG TPA: thioredoxin domain-containing protein [Candidatus Acidoferrum sp.]|nr:thioredoxin domain-containing protein [Candidatus Acidoferrum sp.]
MNSTRKLLTLVLVPLAILPMCLVSRPAAAQQNEGQSPPAPVMKPIAPKQPPAAKPPSEAEELQQAIDHAGNDRASLVRNLEAFLKDYPESRQRAQIYRALVEASLQLRDSTRATDYAERLVAIAPEDMSMTLLAIQLLERNGDEAALRRALNYSTRVRDYIDRSSPGEKSPKVSKEQWEAEQKRDKVNILVLRGRLAFKLHENITAEKDFRASMALSPSAAAGEKLGEIAELNKDSPGAIREYARAFALADSSSAAANRREIRQKLGNVWRLAHGSDQGLGDYILHAYDEAVASSETLKPRRNASAKEPYDFTLRKAEDGSPFPLADQKGKIVVLNFWATWCGPCREMEPHFERVAAQFQGLADVVFLAADCDEDETLVPPYLQEVKPRTTIVFADGLDTLLSVNSFPTVVILDRQGKIAYRAEGFDPDDVETELSNAVRNALAAQKEHAENSAHGAKSAL